MLLMTLRDLQFRRRRILVVTLLTAVVFTLLFLMTGLIQRFNTEPFDAMRSIGADHWVVPDGISGPLTAQSSAASTLVDDVTGADGAVIARGTLFADDGRAEEILLVGVESARIEALALAEGVAPASGESVVVDRLANVAVGDRVEVGTPGGGGYGDPFTRDPAAVLWDVRLGRYSPAQAADLFGVSLQGTPLGVDQDGTARLRAAR